MCEIFENFFLDKNLGDTNTEYYILLFNFLFNKKNVTELKFFNNIDLVCDLPFNIQQKINLFATSILNLLFYFR